MFRSIILRAAGTNCDQETAAALRLAGADGEGRFITKDEKTLNRLIRNKQVIFRYKPRNPNGSSFDIAGITNHRGNVVGLMPHPERFVRPYQHPAWTRQAVAAGGET